MSLKAKVLIRVGKTIIEVEEGEIKIVKGEGKHITQDLPALSGRHLPASSSNGVKYPEIVNDPAFDLDEAERQLMRGEEPKGFLDWLVHILFGPNESEIERIQRIANELEGRHQLREQIIKLVAQKYRVGEALIEAQYSVVIKRLTCETEVQRLKSLKAAYEADEGKSKRALQRAESPNALTEGTNGQDYAIESFFDLMEEDTLNYMKSSK